MISYETRKGKQHVTDATKAIASELFDVWYDATHNVYLYFLSELYIKLLTVSYPATEQAKKVKEAIVRRASALGLDFDENEIAFTEDCGFTFVILKSYFVSVDDSLSVLNYQRLSKSITEVHYVGPEAEIRVSVRYVALFAVISPNGAIMFGDDEDISILQQYCACKSNSNGEGS